MCYSGSQISPVFQSGVTERTLMMQHETDVIDARGMGHLAPLSAGGSWKPAAGFSTTTVCLLSIKARERKYTKAAAEGDAHAFFFPLKFFLKKLITVSNVQ